MKFATVIVAGDQMLRDGDKYALDHQGVLTVRSASRADDAGVYSCVARDRQGHTARRDVSVDVVGKWFRLSS